MRTLRISLLVTVMLAVGSVTGVQAGIVTGNTGSTADTEDFGDHVVTANPTGGTTILYAPSEEDDAAFRAAIQGFTGATVDYFDTRAATPSVAELAAYDCVITWTNFSYADQTAFGDNLAAHVDAGGSVVLGAFTTYTSGNYLSGAIMGSPYCPVSGGTNWFATSDYAGDGTTQIHDGVNAYECQYRDILTLQGAGAQDGSYLDGEIAHAYNPAAAVIYSNGSGAAVLGCTGDWALLMANSCQAGIVPVELQGFDIE
jgi:hypothetical protein